MKLRILCYGINANHDAIVNLHSVRDSRSFSDYDAFIFDPQGFIKESSEIGQVSEVAASIEDISGSLRSRLDRHRDEIKELISDKGGVAIFFVRPNEFNLTARYSSGRFRGDESYNPYFLVEHVDGNSLFFLIKNDLQSGHGNAIKLSQNVRIPSYFNILKGFLSFHASFSGQEAETVGEVLAVNSVNRAVALEVSVGNGTVLFLPVPVDVDPTKLGAALVQTIRERLSKPELESAPAWAESICVPGSEKHDDELAALRLSEQSIKQKIDDLEDARKSLLQHRQLLYSTGKHVLEPAVRRAFSVLGFTVLEPDAYAGEWDLSMTDLDGTYVIGEVEGPEGAVDVDKFRQLLNYQADELLQGKECKAILIGNAHRHQEPESRPVSFTEHTIKGAAKMGFCLLPTPELFKAVCAVLTFNDEIKREKIRQSILKCTGIWKFERPIDVE